MDIKQTLLAGLISIPLILLVGILGTFIGIGFVLGYMYAKGEDIAGIVMRFVKKRIRIGGWNA